MCKIQWHSLWEPICCLDETCFQTGWCRHSPKLSGGRTSFCHLVYGGVWGVSVSHPAGTWSRQLLPSHLTPLPPVEGSAALICLAGANLIQSCFAPASAEVLALCWEATWGSVERGGKDLIEFLWPCLSCLVRESLKLMTGMFSKDPLHVCLGKINTAK